VRFHKRSVDGSGKCDAFFTGNPKDEVWGVIVEIPDNEKRHLDAAEGLSEGYEERLVTVLDEAGGPQTVMAYVAQASHIRSDLQPYCWYLNLVVEGARARGLPDDYISKIANIPCVEDQGVSPGRPAAAVKC
jgi:hypothetical protein